MTSPSEHHEHVPVRTIAATIAMVALTWLAYRVVVATERILIWTVIAGFFAVALYPVVGWTERRVGGRRWLATLIVYLMSGVVLAAIVAVFVVPLVREGSNLVNHAPDYWKDARNGRGPLGELIRRYNIDDWITRNEPKLRASAGSLSGPALNVLRTAVETVAGLLTITVLSYLLVLEGPLIVSGTLALLPDDRRRDRVRKVGADCAKTVTGYITGNLLISVICGVLTYITLLVVGVPNAGLIALFVAFCDLIPLIGATLGAVVATLIAFVHSLPAGVVAVIFFVVYQQVENHLLQPVILSRTVKLNPLTVLFSILVGVELAGVLGALLAIPIAGIIQVVARDVWDNRRGRLKAEPTVGDDERPIDADPLPDDGLDSHGMPVVDRRSGRRLT